MDLRKVIGKMLGPWGRRLIWRFEAKRFVKPYRQRLKGMRALEIGGPSDLFGDKGMLPIYSCLKCADNVNYSTHTLWQSNAVQFEETLVCEGTAIPVHDGSYDCVFSSHSLEHVANPIKALLEWKRVIRDDGLLLLILPNRDYTFDWRRPVTSLDHLRDDFKHDTPETDLTHLDEILALHDLSRDLPAGTADQFKERCLRNSEFRAMHHHVFDAETSARLLTEVGFTVLRQDSKYIHIITLAAKY